MSESDLSPVSDSLAAGIVCRQLCCFCGDRIGNSRKRVAKPDKRFGPLVTYQPTSNDSNVHVYALLLRCPKRPYTPHYCLRATPPGIDRSEGLIDEWLDGHAHSIQRVMQNDAREDTRGETNAPGN